MMTRWLLWLWCMMPVVAWAAGERPVVYLIGDSTVQNRTTGQMGWGDPLVKRFDPARVEVVNRAIGGRSSRTFLTEGRWDAVMAHLKPGDHVILQFGHNDGGPVNEDRCRASLKGGGAESEEIVRKTDGAAETVRTYGWYIRNYIHGAKSRGAVPVVVSPVPRNLWKDGRVQRDGGSYSKWAREAAEAAGASYVPLHDLVADAYDRLGAERVAGFFHGDHTHTSPAGAEFTAGVLAEALRGVEGCGLGAMLLPDGLWLPRIFGDHMVLQRDRELPVWGTTAAGAAVEVRIGGRTHAATADGSGAWKVKLPAMPAGGPYRIEVEAAGVRRIYQDVWVGEVWLCSGQSNMDFTLAKTERRSFSGVADWEREVAAADHPGIRMFAAEWTLRDFPQRDVAGSWAVCSPTTAGDFSAVAYYFGRRLHQELGVPVGLVTCAYGASTVEAWIRRGTLQADAAFAGLLKAYDRKVVAFRDTPQAWLDYAAALERSQGGRKPKNPDPVQDQHNPAVLHNGMIAPVAPYALRGVIWYQGESNVGTRSLYPALQAALIGDLRDLWGDPAMPFLLTQLAAYEAPAEQPAQGGRLAEMREAQAKALSIPHTGMAVTIDIGDATDVHPRNKRDVGERLARLALVDPYQRTKVGSGPVFREAVAEGGHMRLRFDAVGSGLVACGGRLQQFAVAGADGTFHRADARIEGKEVIVSSPEVAEPRQVRYAWAANPEGANLYNREGMPAAPFRSDR